MCEMHLNDGTDVDMKQMFYHTNKTLDCCTVHDRYSVIMFGTGLSGPDLGGLSGSLKALTIL